MKDKLPIKFVRSQMERDYFQLHHTLRWMMRKYCMYTEEEIREAIGIYDLSQEPLKREDYSIMTAEMRQEWERECRRLNPKAWSGRKANRNTPGGIS